MSTKTLRIKKLSRFPKTGDFDELNFEPGFNILVGQPNTGKTQWLRMLSFLMGDRETNPVKIFNEALVDKYESIEGVFLIDEQEITLRRYWKQPGNRGKVFVDDVPIGVDQFSEYFLSLLEIPVLHYPQGNPLSSRTWPELSWRELLRHIYRKQKSWENLASKQVEVAQHACILQFLGIAEYLFSSEYEKLAEKQKEIYRQEVLKSEFVNTLNQVSRELLNERGLGVAITAPSIDSAIQNLTSEFENLQKKRTDFLDSLHQEVLRESSSEQVEILEQSNEKWKQLQSNKKSTLSQLISTQSRLNDLENYSLKIAAEISRIERAKSAGRVFRDLRVTHCPVCEQPVKYERLNSDDCYLCGQPVDLNETKERISEQRLDFEQDQLQGEAKEAQELIDMVRQELEGLEYQQRTVNEEISHLQHKIRATQITAVALLPPEISQIDMDLGRLQERIHQLERVKSVLRKQEDISDSISQLEHDIHQLELEVAKLSQEINFEEASSYLTTQMNTYLNLIKSTNPDSWTQGELSLRLREKGFIFKAGKNSVNKLGATLTRYFLAAYNYALLSLSNSDKYHYPGLTILEFPANFSDGSTEIEVRDHENFILKPFISLVNQPDMQNTQVIAVGRAFENLQNIHRVELNHVW